MWVYFICARSTRNAIEDEYKSRARARFALQKWWKRNVKKFVCKLVICILCEALRPQPFFFASPFFNYIFRLLTLNCCYIHFLAYIFISHFFSILYGSFSFFFPSLSSALFSITIFNLSHFFNAKSFFFDRHFWWFEWIEKSKNANKNENRSWKIVEAQTILIL